MGTGSAAFDSLLGGKYSLDTINLIYGPAASGKTTCCLLAAIAVVKNNGKVIFIDTENGFSIERLKQLCGEDYKEIMENIFLLKIKSFDDQKKKFDMLFKIVKDGRINLVIVDTLGVHYRKVLKEDVTGVNNALIEQLKILKYIIQLGVTVLITNQVYANINEKDKIESVGGKMVKNFSKILIELQNMPHGNRKAILLKPKHKEILFKIKQEGFTLE
jgi:DNA repair protein RadB